MNFFCYISKWLLIPKGWLCDLWSEVLVHKIQCNYSAVQRDSSQVMSKDRRRAPYQHLPHYLPSPHTTFVAYHHCHQWWGGSSCAVMLMNHWWSNISPSFIRECLNEMLLFKSNLFLQLNLVISKLVQPCLVIYETEWHGPDALLLLVTSSRFDQQQNWTQSRDYQPDNWVGFALSCHHPNQRSDNG